MFKNVRLKVANREEPNEKIIDKFINLGFFACSSSIYKRYEGTNEALIEVEFILYDKDEKNKFGEFLYIAWPNYCVQGKNDFSINKIKSDIIREPKEHTKHIEMCFRMILRDLIELKNEGVITFETEGKYGKQMD